MSQYNIIIAGVGGQGLILTTKIICEAAMNGGYDVKSNDVVGLAQRGGRVWGSVKIGKKIHSPNIAVAGADILLGMELLEAFRWKSSLKDKGLAILNEYQIPPVPVIAELEKYPQNIVEEFKKNHHVIALDAIKKSNELGTDKVANILLIGILAKNTDIDKKNWIETIKDSVPEKFVDENLNAFDYGYNL
ncbi:MAG: indolepyruvate oxidoreductase subunit beta [Eubacteriales bacterium]|nr:indolepyruvate oxidoreductase subunit beta [Eubacteriales bacterium]